MGAVGSDIVKLWVAFATFEWDNDTVGVTQSVIFSYLGDIMKCFFILWVIL